MDAIKEFFSVDGLTHWEVTMKSNSCVITNKFTDDYTEVVWRPEPVHTYGKATLTALTPFGNIPKKITESVEDFCERIRIVMEDGE